MGFSLLYGWVYASLIWFLCSTHAFNVFLYLFYLCNLCARVYASILSVNVKHFTCYEMCYIHKIATARIIKVCMCSVIIEVKHGTLTVCLWIIANEIIRRQTTF